MKMVLSLLSAAGCVALLAGCATTMQPYQSAQQIATTTNKYTLGTAPAPDDHMHRFIDTKHSELYMQNHGGSAAVGVLLGPIGVLANIAAIKKQTEADSALLQDKLPIDVQHLFATSMAHAPTLARVEDNAAAPSLAPLLYVVKLDDAHVRFASLVYVTSAFEGKPWVRQYVYELPDSYAKDELARGLSADQLARLAADAEAGFQWIVATYLSDVSGTFHPQQKSVIHSDFISPRIQIAYNGYRFDPGAGRVGFVMGRPASSTIYSLPDDTATVTAAK